MSDFSYPHPYLETYKTELEHHNILKAQEEKIPLLEDSRYKEYSEIFKGLPEFKTKHINYDGPVVEIGRADELTKEQTQLILNALKIFIPWKKGPFKVFDQLIDAEWRSDQKWERILPNTSSLKNKKVADIGCNNGYFMYRICKEQPELVIGFEPYVKHFFSFQLLQRYSQIKNLAFELLGVESIHHYPKFFDTVFCLGILYHHTDPIGILRKIRSSLTPSGELIVDCQGIAGEDSIAFVPPGRYARARGIWFLPTLSCLKNWLIRAQFRNIECFYSEPLAVSEQRTTEWAPINSLEEFLDPNDKTKTIEGHPAPWRFYIKAKR